MGTRCGRASFSSLAVALPEGNPYHGQFHMRSAVCGSASIALSLAALSLSGPAGAAEADDGIPVASALVEAACGACHATDARGRMSRISFQRKSAEGWQITILRMIRTGNIDLGPEDARAVVRYLADHHGLAPEEERPIFYLAEQRSFQESFAAGEELLRETCSGCHLTARFRAQRRTAEEWDLLKGMHVGYFPVIEGQTFRGEPGAERWAVDRVLDQLKERYPFETSAWKNYRAKGPGPGIAGRWFLKGSQPGRGPIAGIVEFRPEDGESGDYAYEANLTHADGTAERRLGAGVLYGGYSFRGRSQGERLQERRAALLLDADGQTLRGRLFRGRFGEDGLDATLTRVAGGVQIAAAWPPAGRIGSTVSGLRILGAGFGEDAADSLDFGSGVRVAGVRRISDGELQADLEIGPEALLGYRDVSISGIRLVDGFAVHDGVDYIRVLPETALARVGGAVAPKQFVQFEVNGWHRGPDGERLTGDDLALGPVAVSWTTEEYYIRDEDADTRFVGNIDERGLFTPGLDGPNPERELDADNMGDVWVVAEHQDPASGETLRDRARLVVAPPVFLYWDLFPQRAAP